MVLEGWAPFITDVMSAKLRCKSFWTCHLFTPIAVLPVLRRVVGRSSGDRQDRAPQARGETNGRTASSLLTEPVPCPVSAFGSAPGVISSRPWDVNAPPTAAASYPCPGEIDGA